MGQRRIPRKRKREADESLEDPLPISLVTQDDREGKNPCFNRKKPPAAANTAASGSSPWQCIKCSYRNEANKKRCVKCHGWKGGRRPQKRHKEAEVPDETAEHYLIDSKT